MALQSAWFGPLPDSNYRSGRRAPVSFLCFHHMDGTLAGADGRFHNANAQVSATFGVPYYADGIVQWVLIGDTAYTQGGTADQPADDPLINDRCWSVEVEDLAQDRVPSAPFEFSDSQYARCAQIAREWGAVTGNPIDRDHVIGHREVPGLATYCPGTLDLNRIVEEAMAEYVTRDEFAAYQTDVRNALEAMKALETKTVLILREVRAALTALG